MVNQGQTSAGGGVGQVVSARPPAGDQIYLSSHTALSALTSLLCSQGDTCEPTQNSLCLLSALSSLLGVNRVFEP